MSIINKKKIEAALREAEAKLRNNQDSPLSERSIEARTAIDCFKYVLELCKEDPGLIENQEVVKYSDEVIKDLAADPITSPLLQIILTGFAAFISHEYPGLESDSHADKARNYLEHIAKQAKASE